MGVNTHIERLAGRRVFVTGHTGFKGSWLVHWLRTLDCEVTGYALPPCTKPDLFTLSQVEAQLTGHCLADIRDGACLAQAMAAARPEVVFHLAAQPIVRRSYAEPAVTWDTNVMGTVNVLEAVRKTDSVRAVVAVTTDKVYENRAWHWGYREADSLGGHDPYSASKAASELVIQSFRKSFFFRDDAPLIASARGGNVIGGGDWSPDRLLADAARAVATGAPLAIRSPLSTRPWQHVLDCLSGYLTLAGALLSRVEGADSAFNFGPPATDNISVAQLLDRLKLVWPGLDWRIQSTEAPLHEANFLYLDSSKAQRELGWAPRWPLNMALETTANWYTDVLQNPGAAPLVLRRQLSEYVA